MIDDDGAAADAAVTAMLKMLVRTGRYEEFMAEISADERAAIEASAERHAARMRAAGHAGW